MSGPPVFYSRSASSVYSLSERLRGVSHWMERRYRNRRGLPVPTKGSGVVSLKAGTTVVFDKTVTID